MEEEDISKLPDALRSVDAFVETYSGEDNASFMQIQEEELRRRRQRDGWGRKLRELRQRDEEKRLRIVGGDVAMIEWKPDLNKQMMGIPDASAIVQTEKLEEDRVVLPVNTRFTEQELRKLHQPLAPKRTPEEEEKLQKLSSLVSKNRLLQSGTERRGAGEQINLDDFYDTQGVDILSEPTILGYGLLSTPKLVHHADAVRFLLCCCCWLLRKSFSSVRMIIQSGETISHG